MSKKLLVIESCAECTRCVHIQDCSREWDACVLMDAPNFRVIPDPYTIPPWCPLPDAPNTPRGREDEAIERFQLKLAIKRMTGDHT